MRRHKRRISRRTPGLSAADRATVWQCASLLMDYPSQGQSLTAVADAVVGLPTSVRTPLRRFLDHREATDLVELQAAYVETFDTRRRCNLFLTYFLHGDTRKRGVALLRFKQTYAAAGLDLSAEELPDHLCVVLEFAAMAGEPGRRLMIDHRAGLEMLRLALHDQASPWAEVMESVSRTLPPLRGDEVEAVRRLAAQGPPAEEVGLTPYGTPAFDASLIEDPPLVEEVAHGPSLVEEVAQQPSRNQPLDVVSRRALARSPQPPDRPPLVEEVAHGASLVEEVAHGASLVEEVAQQPSRNQPLDVVSRRALARSPQPPDRPPLVEEVAQQPSRNQPPVDLPMPVVRDGA